MGDILGGGFLLSLASFVVATAALETGDPYAQLGSSRAKTFSAITEPVVLFVVFTGDDLEQLRARPAHSVERLRPGRGLSDTGRTATHGGVRVRVVPARVA